MYVLSYVLHVRMYDSQSVLTPVSQPARGIDFYLFRTCITVPTIPSYQSYSTCVRYVVCTYVPETLESEQRMDSFPWAERGHKSSYSTHWYVHRAHSHPACVHRIPRMSVERPFSVTSNCKPYSCTELCTHT